MLNNSHFFSYLRHQGSSQWHRYLTLDNHTTVCWNCSKACMFAELGHNWACPVSFAQSSTSTQSECKKGINIMGLKNKQFTPTHLQFGPGVISYIGQMSSWIFIAGWFGSIKDNLSFCKRIKEHPKLNPVHFLLIIHRPSCQLSSFTPHSRETDGTSPGLSFQDHLH